MQHPQKILAIDYGTKRMGLAVSQASLAMPLRVLTYKSEAKVIEQIFSLCEELGVTQLVVGLSEKEMAQKTQHFAEKLAQKTNLPLSFVDETLSSQRVRKIFQDRGKSLASQPIDHFAAALILEEWMDLHPTNVLN